MFRSIIAIAFLLASFPHIANAAVVTVLIGDKDCFGIGGTCADGDHFLDDLGSLFFVDRSEPDDPEGTDIWSNFLSPSFDFMIELGGETASSAELEVFIAGPDVGTGVTFFFNGLDIGSYVEPIGEEDRARTVLLDVPVSALLSDSIIDVIPESTGDGYDIDYLELRITTDEPTVVITPNTIALVFFGWFVWCVSGLNAATRASSNWASRRRRG